jgi:tetratricopeptide (TPR) repeat protein
VIDQRVASTTGQIDDPATAAIEAADHGDIAEAERLARLALDLAGGLPEGPAHDRALARALRPLGTVSRARGRYAEAERTFETAVAAAGAGFGERSLEVAEILNDLGMTLKYAGRFAEAEAAYSRVEAILGSRTDVDPQDMAALFHNLGGLAHARGDFEAAEPLARRAIETRSGAVDQRDPAPLLLDRSAHAAILDGLGRSDEAEAAIRDLLPDLEAALGPDHPEVAVALNNLAAIVQRRGSLDEAEAIYRRVIAIKEARLGADSPALAGALNNLGTVLRAAGRPGEAAPLFERALRLLEGAVEDDHPTLAVIRRNVVRQSSPVAET